MTPRYPKERIPAEIVDAIRSEYVPYKMPLKALAHKHQISISSVWNIVKHYRWHK